jgi:hypothetical protein
MNAVPEIEGVKNDWHNLSHHGQDPAKIEELESHREGRVHRLCRFSHQTEDRVVARQHRRHLRLQPRQRQLPQHREHPARPRRRRLQTRPPHRHRQGEARLLQSLRLTWPSAWAWKRTSSASAPACLTSTRRDAVSATRSAGGATRTGASNALANRRLRAATTTSAKLPTQSPPSQSPSGRA